MVAHSSAFAPSVPCGSVFDRLRGFVSPAQLRLMERLSRGEEGEWFQAKANELLAVIESMPRTGEAGEGAMAQLHYFCGGCHWYIVELDRGAEGDGPDDFQSQVFGVANLGYGPEAGYISLPELFAHGAEIDFHWQPRSVSEILREG